MINVAVGQSQLLINKKFEQFRSLIDKCANKNGENPVTCEDLHGFWDMVYIQVSVKKCIKFKQWKLLFSSFIIADFVKN